MQIEHAGPQDWERVRAVRLRALGDAPDAFGRTLEEELLRVPESWRERLASTSTATFLASVSGADVGLITGAPYAGRDAVGGLFGMWVAPDARGSGVSDALVSAVVDWARAAGYARLVLEVADDNPAAIGLYARHGFTPTGATGTLPAPRTHILEHERALVL